MAVTSRQNGYTLVEILMVVAISLILSVIAYMKWQGTSVSLGAQANSLASDIRYTQTLSTSSGQRYRLVISSGSSSYQILNSAGTAMILANGSTSVTLASGISFGTLSGLPNNLITFDTKGVPYVSTGSPGTKLTTTASIPLVAGSNTITIYITQNTGRVLVQ